MQTDANTEPLPDFLIAGAPRCGTTWLWTNLAAHPEIFMPRRKELHFFDLNYDRGIDWYREFFADAGDRLKGEATPAYLYSDQVFERIQKHLPRVKVLFVLRNPVERAYSHYWYREGERRKEGIRLSFEEKLRQTPRLIEEGMYSTHLERYLTGLDKDRVAVFLQEDIRSAPDQVLESVYGFLGVDPTFRPTLADNEINSSSVKSGRSSLLYKANKALLKLRMPWLARFIGQLNSRAAPPLSPTIYEELVKRYYQADIERLETLIGRDLDTWKRPASGAATDA